MIFYILSLLIAVLSTVSAKSIEESVHMLAAARKPFAPFASPPVLLDGTLFWIGLAVTCALWGTGKFIDVKINRQERHAESVANAI
ncbi:hypothetical protein BY458DRAFT_469923 [Sporodiniella umbellata]|nr:hypothetical protein BY458DRAFT_469923 [Sporodiniella umbellata]